MLAWTRKTMVYRDGKESPGPRYMLKVEMMGLLLDCVLGRHERKRN